ncbi:MAG: His/Gly/Thr/Pro-type tRNA ligase C-terminal domain-containing protein, partial [Burkholderiales bacterium]
HCGVCSLKAQIKRADTSGARFAVIVGDDEAARQMVALKPLREPGEQAQVNADEAARIIRSPNFSTT